MSEGARRLLLRAGVSVSVLVAVAFTVDVGEVAGHLAEMSMGWVALALIVSVAQVLVSAWRWRFTASRLGIRLPLKTAVAEYYLATFLNQVLPGGVLGDVSRAWRHARTATVESHRDHGEGEGLRFIHAVVLERASGQMVMALVAVAAAGVLLLPRAGEDGPVLPGWPVPDWPLPDVSATVAGWTLAVAALLAGGLAWVLVRRAVHVPAFGRFLEHGRRALLGRALPVQLGLSLLVVASYVLVFLLAARAVGVPTPWSILAPLVPPLLLTMLVPVSVAGWGVREGTAAVLWSAVGLTSAEGVAISVAYGLLVLLSSLPGAAVIVFTLRGDAARDRRAGPRPGEGAGPEAGAPRPASPPSAG